MVKVGISQCLLGAKVRFDGGHRNNRFCQDELSKFVSFVSMCPEVGIGLPVPRKTIRLVKDSAKNATNAVKAVYSDDYSQDFTKDLQDFAESKYSALEQLSGFVFCRASPSCGVERVKVYSDSTEANKSGQSEKNGVGIFAAKVKELFPLLPIEEDGRLNDAKIRDSFIKRVLIYKEWQELINRGVTRKRLYNFHARHKMTVLAHCQKTYRKLGPLVASIKDNNVFEVSEAYIAEFMTSLAKISTRKNNTNVLMHLQGYLKKHLSSKDKVELANCILEYRDGTLPILSPLTLLKHHFNHHPNQYVENISYLKPYPKQLGIRVSMG